MTLKVGAYVTGGTVAALETFETLVGRKQDFFVFFKAFTESWNAALCQSLIDRGTIPILTCQPDGYYLDDITDGLMDAYIAARIAEIKTVDGSVWLRLMHEMNGTWYDWGWGKSDNTPTKYIAAWKYIVDKFRVASVTNVEWLFCPNHNGKDLDAGNDWGANSIPAYYPGSGYVDILGLDGYNLATENWRSFRGIFDSTYRGSAYDVMTALHPTADLHIVETASVETALSAGIKASWIADFYNRAAYSGNYPRIKGICWFNQTTSAYKVDSTAGALAAFKVHMANLDKHISVVYANSTDGHVERWAGDTVWATARGAATGSDDSITGDHLHTRAYKSGAAFIVSRAIMPFTTALPGGAAVIEATLSMATYEIVTSGDAIVACLTDLLGITDDGTWTEYAIAHYTTECGRLTSAAAVGYQNRVTINTNVFTIPSAGTFAIGLRAGKDFDNTEPTDGSYASISSAGTDLDEKAPFITLAYEISEPCRRFRHNAW